MTYPRQTTAPTPKADTMPALNITFTDAELDQIRNATAEEDTSLKNFVHDAALAAAQDNKIAMLTARSLRVNAGVNKRLIDL